MEYYLVLIAVSLFIGLSKGGMGAVLIILVTPLLSLVMPTASAISLALPLLLIGDVFALYSYWNTWDMRYIRLMLPPAILGIVVGTILLNSLDNLTLRHILGIFTLIFVVYRVADQRFKSLGYHPRNWHGYLAGAASGLGSALANSGSPPFTAYMLLQDVSPQVFVGTMTLFFAVVNALKVPGLMITGLMDFNRLVSVAWVIPVIPLGVFTGRWVIVRINKRAFEWFMLFVLVAAAAILLFAQ